MSSIIDSSESHYEQALESLADADSWEEGSPRATHHLAKAQVHATIFAGVTSLEAAAV